MNSEIYLNVCGYPGVPEPQMKDIGYPQFEMKQEVKKMEDILDDKKTLLLYN